ncbi:MAG: helix-turn-helix transcriptional regulator [Lachnospiraceae bacterium]|nr:helix-turn-helix transcriptional regulator [Lachnospiraceae bacterium]
MTNYDESVLGNFSKKNLMQVAERLTFLRNDILHLNQSQCASILGISQTYLSLIESGKRKIKMDTVYTYVERLNVNIEWILYGNDEKGIVGNEPKFNSEYLVQKQKQDCLLSLKNTFNLDDVEIDFISKYLSQDKSKRKRFIQTLKDLKNFI